MAKFPNLSIFVLATLMATWTTAQAAPLSTPSNIGIGPSTISSGNSNSEVLLEKRIFNSFKHGDDPKAVRRVEAVRDAIEREHGPDALHRDTAESRKLVEKLGNAAMENGVGHPEFLDIWHKVKYIE